LFGGLLRQPHPGFVPGRHDLAHLLQPSCGTRPRCATQEVSEPPAGTRIKIEEITEAQFRKQLGETYKDPEAAGRYFDRYVSERQKALEAFLGSARTRRSPRRSRETRSRC